MREPSSLGREPLRLLKSTCLQGQEVGDARSTPGSSHRICSAVPMAPSWLGNVPLSRLSPSRLEEGSQREGSGRARTHIRNTLVRRPSSVGMDPVSALDLSSSSVSPVSWPKWLGMLPAKTLDRTFLRGRLASSQGSPRTQEKVRSQIRQAGHVPKLGRQGAREAVYAQIPKQAKGRSLRAPRSPPGTHSTVMESQAPMSVGMVPVISSRFASHAPVLHDECSVSSSLKICSVEPETARYLASERRTRPPPTTRRRRRAAARLRPPTGARAILAHRPTRAQPASSDPTAHARAADRGLGWAVLSSRRRHVSPGLKLSRRC